MLSVASLASEERVCHIRDCDHFPQFLSPSTPHARAMQARWSRTTRSVLSTVESLFCAIYFNQADSCHPRTPTSQGSVNDVAAFYADCFNWQRSPVLTFASRYVHPYIQFISRRYAVRSRLGEAQPVAHGCWTPALMTQPVCGTRIYPRTGAILFAYVPTSLRW